MNLVTVIKAINNPLRCGTPARYLSGSNARYCCGSPACETAELEGERWRNDEDAHYADL